MGDALQLALDRFDAAYGPERDERYYTIRQALLQLAADLGYKKDTTAHVVGLTLAKGMW